MNQRILDKTKLPDEQNLADWLGEEGYGRWKEITCFIEANYPCVFVPDWIYGGMRHGWSLRYKKSKSFCTLVPERGQLVVVIVFGAEEREKAEGILPELTSHVRADYEAATTYHDGKWLGLIVDSDEAISDIKRLLAIKRRPRPVL